MANDSNLRPFKKGDPRINRNGRPKSFDAMRTLTQAIAHEVARKPTGEPVTWDGHTLTIVEAILRSWAQSKKPALQIKFMEIAFGKVPDAVQVTGKDNEPFCITIDEWKHDNEIRTGKRGADDGAGGA